MSSVTQTPGTTLRLRTRDESGNDQDLKLPIRVNETPWLSKKGLGGITTLAMEDFSGRNYGGVIKDVFGAALTDLTKRTPFARWLETSPWWSHERCPVLQLYGGDVVADAVQSDFKASISLQGSVKLGVEVVFGYTNEMLEENGRLGLVVEQFDGTNESRGQFRYTPTGGVVEYENSAGGFTNLDTKTSSSIQSGYWTYMRVEVDFSKSPPQYIEAQLNDSLYTALAGQAIVVQADTTAKKAGWELHLWNNTGTVHGTEFFIRFIHLYRIL